jgi:hypothetical protein
MSSEIIGKVIPLTVAQDVRRATAVRQRLPLVAGRYFSASVNLRHAAAGTQSVAPVRLVVSRTRITPLLASDVTLCSSV